MKVALLADTHAGVRNNSPVFMSHQIRFFESVFFPYVEQNQIRHLIHLGDVFDRRKDTNNFALHEWDDRVFRRWHEQFDDVQIVIGNHDTYFKNTNSVNTPQRLLSKYSSFRFHSDPHEEVLYGMRTLFIPWVCDGTEEKVESIIQNSEADIVMGHLEILGSPMFRGIDNIDRGFSPSVFEKFKLVLSGHFHLKSHQGNINYLGSPSATTWSEAYDMRGFHVLDTDTLQIEFVVNPESPFVHIEYCEDSPKPLPDVRGKIVRVIVKTKSIETNFLQFLESIESENPAELNVVENVPTSSIQLQSDESLDMFSLIDGYVDATASESHKADLKALLRNLYQEALHLHDITE